MASLQGIVALENGVALYDQDECKLKFEFFPNRVRVTQLNDEGCGFGANVTAAGYLPKIRQQETQIRFLAGNRRSLLASFLRCLTAMFR